MGDRPPVQCGNCGARITFAPGQLVGDPNAVAEVKRLRAKTVEYVATTKGKQLPFHVVDHGTSLTVYVHEGANEALNEAPAGVEPA